MGESLQMEMMSVTGDVKWFDPAKGYGFLTADIGGNKEDILLHGNTLRNFGRSSVADDTTMTVVAKQTERGWQAQEVITIVSEKGERTDISSFQPARVKWFDLNKGYGFANIFGVPDDVFLHIDRLQEGGFSALQSGEAIAIVVGDNDRGKVATAITSWGAAAESTLLAAE